MAVYERLLAELDGGGQRLSEQISEIDLTDPEDARVLMPEPGADILAHFGEEQFLERYQRYKAHIAEWRQQYPKLAAVDLRYEQQVVLEMKPGAGGAQSAAAPGLAGTKVIDELGQTKPPGGQPVTADAAQADASAAQLKPAAGTRLKPAAKPAPKTIDKKKSAAAKAKKKHAEPRNAAVKAPQPKPHTAAGQGQ